MSPRDLHYRWTYDLKSSPEDLWPFVSDTNRFNRDTGVPSVEPGKTPQQLRNARQRLRLSIYGMAVEWEFTKDRGIAVTLNDRLDYFGSTVNMEARLEALSTVDDVVISHAIYDDPEVRELLRAENLQAASFEIMLKGFDEEKFELAGKQEERFCRGFTRMNANQNLRKFSFSLVCASFVFSVPLW